LSCLFNNHHSSSFVHALSTVTSAHIYSKNNYFEYLSEWFVSVYRFEATNFENYNIDISGDNYMNNLIAGSSYTSITSSSLKKEKEVSRLFILPGTSWLEPSLQI
jgi:pectate lyase